MTPLEVTQTFTYIHIHIYILAHTYINTHIYVLTSLHTYVLQQLPTYIDLICIHFPSYFGLRGVSGAHLHRPELRFPPAFGPSAENHLGVARKVLECQHWTYGLWLFPVRPGPHESRDLAWDGFLYLAP